MEGAEGASQITKLVASYSAQPPTRLAGLDVVGLRNFAGEETFLDTEGDPIPKEKMLILDLSGGYKVAVRPSGTEPKIKYYLFGNRRPAAGAALSVEELAAAKGEVGATLANLWADLSADVQARLAA
jgi:phosphoglucomutase